MLDLEKIKERRETAGYWEHFTSVKVALADIDALLAEVERLREAADLQPCGHPRSAIVSNESELISDYCGMCNAEAEAEVR